MYEVSSFYALTPLSPSEMESLLAQLQDWPLGDPPLRGLVLLAPDGLNATIAGTETTVAELENWFRERFRLSRCKRSRCPGPPFRRWKVVTRRETIASGSIAKAAAAIETSGHLSPAEWHNKLEHEQVVVIDVRNDYEVNLGKFCGALDPKTTKFSEFVDFVAQLQLPKEQPILTYCTGGIRCEKAVPYLKAQGYHNVYQLEGGILNYLEHYPQGFFEGECFVFDDRVALDQNLQPTTRYLRCPDCGQPGPDTFPCCH